MNLRKPELSRLSVMIQERGTSDFKHQILQDQLKYATLTRSIIKFTDRIVSNGSSGNDCLFALETVSLFITTCYM